MAGDSPHRREYTPAGGVYEPSGLTLLDQKTAPLQLDAAGNLKVVNGTTFTVREAQGTAASRAATQAIADGVRLAANTSRIRYSIYNDSDQDYYHGEGTTVVTTSDFTARLRPGASWSSSDFTGQLRGFLAGAPGSGSVYITEIT